MKKIFVIACAALLSFASCTKDLENRVGALENDVESIQKQLTELSEKLNNEVDNLKQLIDALKNNVFVTGVTEIKEDGKVVGYTINLSKGQAITIYHGTNGKDGYNGLDGSNGKDGKDGQDAVAPTVGVVVEDGVYYWAVNGVALTDAEGNKIPVYAETDAPEFKYEDGKWWISTDGTWSPLVSAGTGESVFSDVQYDDTTVTFVLADGTEIVLPRQAAFSLNIANTEVVVLPGETVKVAYTINGATETTAVYAVADGGFSVKVEAASASEGNLAITAPSPLTDGKVVVFAGDNTHAAMQVLTFEEGALTLVSDTYNVEQAGGVVEVPVVTNLDYKVEVSADWIKYTETKAMREETLVFAVEENKGSERTATVTLTVNDIAVQTITVTQATAAEPQFALEDIYGAWKVTYGNGSSYEWTFYESDDLSKGNIRIEYLFGKSGNPVYATLDLYSGVLTIQLRQKCTDNFGYLSWLCTKEGTSSISYTFHEDMTFDSGTATLAYAYYETSDPLSQSYLSDLKGVKKDENALEVGNYYYADGTCSSKFDATKTLVGIVFWLGDATANDPALKAAFPECAKGLAMAVNPVEDIKWQTNTASIAEWQAENMSDYTSIQVNYAPNAPNLDKELGYSNTQVLKAYNAANPETAADVYASLVEFAAATPAPAGTSGWYIPSAKEVSYMCYGNNNNAYYASGTTNLAAMNVKIQAAGLDKITFGYLASSSEISATEAYAFQGTYLGKPNKTYNFTLCPVFAF